MKFYNKKHAKLQRIFVQMTVYLCTYIISSSVLSSGLQKF
jgi:hypothetical protein